MDSLGKIVLSQQRKILKVLKMKGFGNQHKSKKKSNKKTKTSKEQLINQAINFHLQGNISEASKYYQYCINQGFNDQRVFSNYGLILKSLGKLQEAEVYTRKAIKIQPDHVEAHSNLGMILRDLGELNEAEVSTRKAIEIKPDYAEAHSNLGNILRDLGKLKEAEIYTRKAIEIQPDFALSHMNLGIILSDIGKLKEAEISIRQAIKLNPAYARAFLNLGNILKDLGKLEEAEISTRQAIKLNPHYARAYSNLSAILMEMDINKIHEAEISLLKAIELNPNFAAAYTNLANIKRDRGQLIEAINLYKKAINLNAKSSSAKSGLISCQSLICDWSDQNKQNIWLKSLGIEGPSVSTLDLLYCEDNPFKQLQRSINFFKERYSRESKSISFYNKDKIHIAYFSADFRAHPVMYLMASILELHDKSRFTIYLYSFSPTKEDIHTERAKNSGCLFRDIKNLSEVEAVELAREDKIDIAIDLMGYTQHNRMNIFSNRVAPIQINYLGYPGTVGSDNIDYIISDNIIIPNEYEKFYSEKVIRMPYCYLGHDEKREMIKEKISRKDYNLPEEGFVFTCFNANKKITPREFNIWMRLLKEIKGSVLWLYKSNKWSVDNLYKEAEKREIDPSRLIFASSVNLNKHLDRHSLGDLGLDTFNYNGHLTTSEALWTGLPVLTKIGESFAARVSASILHALGVPELITYTEEEYERTAIRLANNNNELKRIKLKINNLKDKSPLYDATSFTRDLENIFRGLLP